MADPHDGDSLMVMSFIKICREKMIRLDPNTPEDRFTDDFIVLSGLLRLNAELDYRLPPTKKETENA